MDKKDKKTALPTRFFFWQQWLFYSSIIFALAGVFFALDGDSPLFGAYNAALAKAFWHTDKIPADVEPFRAFIWAPFGGTIACCYILLAYIAWYPFRQKQVWARNAIILAYTTWIVLDSAACIYYGVYLQLIMINTFSFVIKALPLIFTWKDFNKHPIDLKTNHAL